MVCLTPLLQNVSDVPMQMALKLAGSHSVPAAQANALAPDDVKQPRLYFAQSVRDSCPSVQLTSTLPSQRSVVSPKGPLLQAAPLPRQCAPVMPDGLHVESTLAQSFCCRMPLLHDCTIVPLQVAAPPEQVPKPQSVLPLL